MIVRNHWGTIASMNTATTIAIDNLSVADKIVLMERLWDDLSRHPTDVASPDWHGDILDDRRASVREGRTAFVEWDEVTIRLSAVCCRLSAVHRESFTSKPHRRKTLRRSRF